MLRRKLQQLTEIVGVEVAEREGFEPSKGF